MDLVLDPGQQAIVEHDIGPLLVLSSFGSGASTALRARAERLVVCGRTTLLLHHRGDPPLPRRHGGAGPRRRGRRGRASGLALRDDAVLRAERSRFDEVVVDDFQLATFTEQRLLTQLVGRDGPLIVAGNPDAAVSSAPLASEPFLDRFDRRFACPTGGLAHPHRRPQSPRLHRDRRWLGAERLRFRVASTRAVERTTVISSPEPSPFLLSALVAPA